METEPWTPFQYPIRHLIMRSCEVLKPQVLYLKLSDWSEIWRAHWQHCCWYASQISKQCNNSNCPSRGFETSWDFTIRCVIRYWNGAQVSRWLNCPSWPSIALLGTEQTLYSPHHLQTIGIHLASTELGIMELLALTDMGHFRYVVVIFPKYSQKIFCWAPMREKCIVIFVKNLRFYVFYYR